MRRIICSLLFLFCPILGQAGFDPVLLHQRENVLLIAPDPALTPGAVRSTNRAEVCTRGYAARQQPVSRSLKLAVYKRYAMVTHVAFAYQLDHLIARELGGATVLTNIWPQPVSGTPWTSGQKNRLENELRRRVCVVKDVSLVQAQHEIAQDWIGAYTKYVGAPK